jgi:CRP-like cAMP-binding protein
MSCNVQVLWYYMIREVHNPAMTDSASFITALLADEGDSLRGAMETVHLSDGEILFRRGESGDAFYIIDAGQIRIFTLDEDGSELTLNALGAGEAFGELALVDDRPRSASAAALGATTLRCLRREDFLARLHTSPVLTNTVVRLLSQRTRHMTDYIERLGQWARLIAEGQYDQAMENIRAEANVSDRALAAVADAVGFMVQAVQEREKQLQEEVAQLRIQIDEAKREEQVSEITETDYFQELTQHADGLRKRRASRKSR